MRWYIIIPGARPKVIISAKLSNCFPISEFTLSNLDKNPSKKSKKDPPKIKRPEYINFPLNAIIIDKMPQIRFDNVIRLGIFLLIAFINLQ